MPIAAAAIAAALALCASPALAQPSNDLCAAATPAPVGATTLGTLLAATADGDSTCSGGAAPDVFHTLTTGPEGVYQISLCTVTAFDSVLSLHSACPATPTNEIVCDDDGCREPGSTAVGVPSTLKAYLAASTTYIVRIAAFDAQSPVGPYALTISGPAAPTGACCAPSGACTISAQSACLAASGTYAGDLSACALAAQTPQTFADTAVDVPIPDGTGAAVDRTITIPDTFSVGDVRLSLNLTHGFIGDLMVTLTHGPQTATIFHRVGLGTLGSDATLHGIFDFTDSAPATIWAQAPTPASGHPVPPGSYLCSDALANPVSLRQTFSGTSAAGAWSLHIVDASSGYSGTLHAWSLTLDRASTTPRCTPQLGACCAAAACTQSTQPACAGSFQGVGVACSPNPANPTTCCPANFNHIGGLDVQDIFDFLNAWLAGNPAADFNHAAGLDVQDIFDFLNAWLAGC